MSRGHSFALRPVLALSCVAGAFFPAAAYAQAQTGQSEVGAIVVTSLSLIKGDDLEFGTMLAGTIAGTVIVPPNGVRTKTGGVTLVGNTFQPARFAGRGRVGQNVTIRINANNLTLNRIGGGATMRVNTWVIGSTPTAPITTAPRTFRISAANGIFTFPLGATLEVGANQRPGVYSGTFTLTLNYQ
jgi:Domain of unknown function (DUF4402)